MRIHIKTISLVLAIIVTGRLTFYSMQLHKASRRAATASYVASVGAFIERELHSDLIREITTAMGNKWRFLNRQEYDMLARTMSKSRSLDRGKRSHEPERILLDHWGNHILIAGRTSDKGTVEFLVWSKGPDGDFGTEDDIASPWGRTPPEELTQELG